MQSSPVAAASPFFSTRYAADLAAALGGAAVGTLGIVLLYKEPLPICVYMVLLLAVLLLRWHTRADVVGLVMGLTLGNLTEFLCDVTGVWVHHDRSIMNAAPVYIFFCYPILWLTVPRLMDALLRRSRPSSHAQGNAPYVAIALWATHLGLSMVYGTRNAYELVVCAVILGLTLWRFHEPHDVATALFGGFLGLVWEIPATVSGAWRFPDPQIFGLIPFWLPMAYAIFFVNLSRLNAWLVDRFATTSSR